MNPKTNTERIFDYEVIMLEIPHQYYDVLVKAAKVANMPTDEFVLAAGILAAEDIIEKEDTVRGKI